MTNIKKRNRDIVRRFKRGESRDRIAVSYGLTPHRVSQIAWKAGARRRHLAVWDRPEHRSLFREVKRSYTKDGMSLAMLANITGYGIQTIARFLEAQGIPRRPAGRPKT